MTDSIHIDQPPAARAPRRRMAIALAGVLAAAVLAAGGVVGWLLLRDSTITITGHLEIGDGGFHQVAGGHCVGDGGYGDIQPGAQVVITDAAGTTIAVGNLGAGSWVGSRCEFPFTVATPAGEDFYGVQVGGRNTVQYPADRLDRPIVLTLG